MTERLPSHNFDWFALLEIGFVPADIWISWFGPFAFVKPNLSHLRVLELECWISPETSFVFSMSNHPHFRTGDIHICQSSLYGWLQSASSILIGLLYWRLDLSQIPKRSSWVPGSPKGGQFWNSGEGCSQLRRIRRTSFPCFSNLITSPLLHPCTATLE